MPELPEVEVLARHLHGVLVGRRILELSIARTKVCRPNSPADLCRSLVGSRFQAVTRRGKYLLFHLKTPVGAPAPSMLIGHLGMTGRLFVQAKSDPLPRHTAAHFTLDRGRLIFLDARLFGRLTTDAQILVRLGPEPFDPAFTASRFGALLARSRQPIKVRLMDQSALAGVGNIYASESLFRARIHPARPANQLGPKEVSTLRRALLYVLRDAIALGSTVPLRWSGQGLRDRLFYYGQDHDIPGHYEERLRVYDRENQPCRRCRNPVRRLVQAARSTYFCPVCQPR